MFNCDQCPSVFARKDGLVRHGKIHAGIRFPCTVCTSTFNDKSHLKRHMKNIHGIVNVPAHLRPMSAAPIITQPVEQRIVQVAPAQVQIAPQIFVPDVPAGGSNMLTEDEMCMEAMDEFEDTG
ncbi:zinc finger protein 746-like [Metopolophium dirhodum]|uniref:zinc finger protein 746-like n=1 Tax=Metopolophium dirhodum TaxID=44670 RepID=UPI00298F66D2|nr:zinc finger protein 746-like [Metopolophium dirhodum]XP_060863321.1 zinc finger protein 746-like [Metopolophium dirhodum]